MARLDGNMPSTPAGRSGKVKDPLFLLMVVAMSLAVISSIILRAYVPSMGPSSARADAVEETPAPMSPAHHPTTLPSEP